MDKNKIQVILVAGNGPGCGKSTFSAALKDGLRNHNYAVAMKSFAAPLKRMLATLFKDLGMAPAAIHSRLYGDMKNDPIGNAGNDVSARMMMQKLGTEWREMCGCPDIWRDILYLSLQDMPEMDYFIVDDWRFLDELTRAEIYEDIEVTTIFVRRAEVKVINDTPHRSEGEIQSTDCEWVVVNDGSERDLIAAAKRIAYLLSSARR